MRGRMLKLVFGAISLLFWMAVCALLVEWGTRLLMPEGAVNEFASPIISRAEEQDLEAFSATAAKAPRPPADVEARYPVLEALDSAADPEVAALAVRWDSLILRCTLSGDIGKRFAPAPPEPAAKFAAKTAAAANVSALLPAEHPEYGKDLLTRIERSVKDWREPPPLLPHMVGCYNPCVDYQVALPDTPNAGFRFMFRPYAIPGRAEPDIYVVAAPWRWDAFVSRFRADYYERQSYPQFPKSEFWTNHRGFRDQEIAVPKPKGCYRIICIGGSTTVEGPRNDLTYPKMLERMLREHFRTDTIEVINCGVDGGSIGAQTTWFDECLALEPNLVVHYNFVNDSKMLIDDVLQNTVVKTPRQLRTMKFLSESRFLTQRIRRLWSKAMPREADYREKIEQHIIPFLRELRERSERSGARFALSSFACPGFDTLAPKEQLWFRNHFWFQQVIRIQFEDYALSADAFNAAARAFCEKEGALYIPSAEGIKGGLDTFTDHCHLHVSGIRRKAQIMFDSLKAVISKDLEASRNSS